MDACININSGEFRTLATRSGLSDFVVEAYCRKYQDEFGRWPHLDELPGADSRDAFEKHIKLKEDGTTKIENILEATGKQSIEESVISLNDQFRDLEVEILPVTENAIVKVTKRPSIFSSDEVVPIEYKGKVNDTVAFNQIFDKLQRLYGITIHPITTQELMGEEFAELVPSAKNTQAFIYNGEIFVNTDIASFDAPVHELMHMLLGGVRYANPDLYQQLIQSAQEFENINVIAQEYPNRTQGDVLEEVFVHEFAKYLIGEDSLIKNLPKEVQNEIFYNMNRMLDSIFMGDLSAQSMDPSEIVGMSLSDIAKRLNSDLINNKFRISLDDATIHRIMGNKKEELMRQGKLREVCL